MTDLKSRRAFLKATGLAAVSSFLGYLRFPAVAKAAEGGKVTSEDIRASIREAINWLKQKQNGDGSWSGGGQKGGATALSLLALLNAGVDKNDPVVLKALANLERVPDNYVYTVSLKIQVYVLIDPVKYATQIKQAVLFLAAAQKANGMWTYRKDNRRGGDNSNTQFALLGLHVAAAAGVQVPRGNTRAEKPEATDP